MAAYLDKFEVSTAVHESSKLDLSCQHITTADWMQLNPIYVKEMVPTEKLAVNAQTFTRMAPMPVPTFGRANVHQRAFFVPYRTVWKGWTDFITDTVHVAGDQTSAIANSAPRFAMSELVCAFLEKNMPLYSEVKAYDASTAASTPFDNYDLVTPIGWIYNNMNGAGPYNGVTPSATNGFAFKFNRFGRQAMKILNSLGYQLVAANGTEWNSMYMSALPLMAFFKVYIDWYFPSAYYGDTYRTLIEGILGRDTSTPFILTSTQLATIFALISYVNYDSDYFVSAFDNPQGPNTGSYSNVTINDITNTVSSGQAGSFLNRPNKVTLNSVGTPISVKVETDPNNGVPTLSQYVLQGLKALTDYMKRHQLVGARAMDRYLARFGKKLTAEKLNRSLYIGAKSFPLQIGDVMSQSDTSGAQLGAYAGKGLGYGETTFGYETDEYGLFIITCSLVPTVGYYQGLDRNVLHLNRLDFWTPEFDQLGNQAIGSAELYLPSKPSDMVENANGTTSTILNGLSTQIFGYAPRYAEYKVGRDRLTGDFRLPRLSAAGDTTNSWHLMREFDAYHDFNNNASNIQHSLNFVQGMDASQFNRIFYNTEDTADHFYMVHNFDVASYSKMAKLYDTYEFEDEYKSEKVTQEVNGVKVN